MTRFMVYPWKMASEGAKMLADALGGKRIRLEGSDYTPRADDVIVNWGNGNSRFRTLPEGCIMLNPDPNICISKTKFFERMQGHNIVPPFAFSRDEALRHLSFPIICRTTTEGADGQGIVIANDAGQLVHASLYTQLMEKVAEYRVHMGRMPDGTVELICAQKKRLGINHSGDIWTGEHVFLDWCDPADLPRPVFDITTRSMELMPELHFGGFDTILTDNWGARVIEVNSAPMMTEGTTRKYVEFINRYVAMARSPATIEPESFQEDSSETEDYQRGYADAWREARRIMMNMFPPEERE